jgi:hypothetical protein
VRRCAEHPAAASTKVLFAQLKVQRIERHRLRQLFLRKIPATRTTIRAERYTS